MEEFKRIGEYFNPESPTMKMNGKEEFSTSEALKWYGIIMQGLYGDNNTEAPSWFSLVERMKWNAWDKVRG